MNFGHVLIFGGTGMLQQATVWVSKHATRTIAFARNKHRLHQLEEQCDSLKGMELDYTDTDALITRIKEAYAEHGPIDMVIAWIHGTAPDAIPAIIQQISELQSHPWTFVMIKGSSSHLKVIQHEYENIPDNCTVKVVQLGFVYEGISSRWLTHQEISEGVIQAIQGENRKTVVGTLEPWEKRP